ncbi:MAG TPA: oligosaccharide flippase family protein [Candidatus Eisenbacteria bacterium]
MSRLRANLIAGFAGRAWTAAMALVFVPVVVHRLGIEAYGLVGVYASLQALVVLLDLGLGLTLNRELARLSAIPGEEARMRDVMRTLELVYWGIGIAILAALAPLVPWLAHHWLKPVRLPDATVQRSLLMMTAVVAARWPLALYSGGLSGLQRQVPLNAINAIMATVQNGGAVAVLYVLPPAPEPYFAWLLGAGLLQTALVGWFLWRSLPRAAARPAFRSDILRGVGGFAAGTAGIAVTAVVLQQLDKVVLSRVLTLEAFGYYTLAGVAASSLYRVIEPVFAALYPRLTELAAGRSEGLAEFYHRASQLLSLLLLPAAAVLAAFAPELLLLWTGDPALVANASALVGILATGTALNGMMTVPYALQLASGWPQLALRLNLIACVVIAPLMWWLAHARGAPGAASVWVGVNAFYLVVGLRLMHRRLLPGELARWYRDALLRPLAAAALVAIVARLLWRRPLGTALTLAGIAAVSLAALAATAAVLPAARREIGIRLGRRTRVPV